MELVTLFSLNLAFGLGLYIFLSSKMNRVLKESQGVRLEKKIQSMSSLFMRESSQYIELLEGKIKGLRDLVIRSEKIWEELNKEASIGSGVSIQLQNLINQSKDLLNSPIPTKPKLVDPISSGSDSQKDYPVANKIDLSKKIHRYEENKPSRDIADAFPTSPINEAMPDSNPLASEIGVGMLAEIGKKFKNFVGIQDLDTSPSISAIPKPSPSMENFIKNNPQQTPATRNVAYTIGGNPLDEGVENIIFDQNNPPLESPFLSTMKELGKEKKPQDEIQISTDALLAELPPSATKIDKVVLLLKKGYSHEEVSSLLDIGTREVSLIETVRLQKARRV